MGWVLYWLPCTYISVFFEGKATEHLSLRAVKPEHLNDDRLGRVMDKLYTKGLSQLFTSVALAAKKYGVSTKSSHLKLLFLISSAWEV